MTISNFGVLHALGVRVRRVADLDEGAIYIARFRMLLLDDNLNDTQAEKAVDQVLPSLWAQAG